MLRTLQKFAASHLKLDTAVRYTARRIGLVG